MQPSVHGRVASQTEQSASEDPSSVVEQRLDDGADLVADVWSHGAELMDESVAVDRPNQLALDAAGGVETGVGAGLDFDMQ